MDLNRYIFYAPFCNRCFSMTFLPPVFFCIRLLSFILALHFQLLPLAISFTLCNPVISSSISKENVVQIILCTFRYLPHRIRINSANPKRDAKRKILSEYYGEDDDDGDDDGDGDREDGQKAFQLIPLKSEHKDDFKRILKSVCNSAAMFNVVCRHISYARCIFAHPNRR